MDAVITMVVGLVVCVLLVVLIVRSDKPGAGEGGRKPHSNDPWRYDRWTAESRSRFAEWNRRHGKAPGRQPGQPVPKPDRVEEAALVLLGLKPGASVETINRAWRREAAKYHPDRNPRGAARMKAINNARDVLIAKRSR